MAFPSYRLPAAFLLIAATLSTTASATGAAAEVEHIVGKGHTVQSIAHRYHVSVQALLERNNLGRRAHLKPGEVIVVPSKDDDAKKDADAKSGKSKPDHKLTREERAEERERKADEARAEKEKKADEAKAEKEKKAEEAKAAKEKELKAHEKERKYAGKPDHPGVIRVHRLATTEDIAVKVNTRGKTGVEASRKLVHFMRFSTGAEHAIDPLMGTVSDHFAGRKLEVISGYRPFTVKQYTPHSRHNHGKAVDFRVTGVPNEIVRDFCRTLKNTGCGYYPNSVFVHMDARDESAYWIDYSRPGEPPRYHGGKGHSHADEGTSDVHADHDLSKVESDAPKTEEAATKTDDALKATPSAPAEPPPSP
jgi:uncharacterized protein YcbK (DUF882 family)